MDRNPSAAPTGSRITMIFAFAAVYIIWGSTYLGIRIAIESIPPLLMAGSRYLAAGCILYAAALAMKVNRPKPAHWRTAIIMGFLLIVLGNGCVALAERYVPSGIASLIVAIAPLWFVVFDWAFFKGKKPNIRIVTGLVMGFSGIIVLISNQIFDVRGTFAAGSVLIIITGNIGWAFGSLYSRKAPAAENPLQMSAMQMLCGGAMLLLAGTLRGEATHFVLSDVTMRSFLAWAYLVAFGSLVAYTAYTWLVRNVPASMASTYAYVNPVIAVFLGWMWGHENISISTFAGAAIVIAAVFLITRRKG